MPRATESIYVVAGADEATQTPAYGVCVGALEKPGEEFQGVHLNEAWATRRFEHDGPELLVELPTEVDGVKLEPDMVVWGMVHIFVDSGRQMRPTDLRLPEVEKKYRSSTWD